MKKQSVNVAVFFCGAAVMAMELTGARILAPFLGTSIFVWTSLIGVVLASLSLGNYLGGVIADRKPDARILSSVVLIAGIMIALVALAADPFLMFLQPRVGDVRTGSAIAGMVLFAPPSMLLGIVAPYAIRLKLHELAHTGAVAGGLYALSTLGSIAGTFLTGFVLLSHLSHQTVMLLISATLILISALIFPARSRVILPAGMALTGLLSIVPPAIGVIMGDDFTEYSTPYNRVWVYDAYQGGRPVRIMQINDTMDSCMYLDSGEPVLSYAKHFEMAESFVPDMKSALLIGGGAYTFPSYFADRHPGVPMDVVEIDPDLLDISRRHFRYRDRPNLRVFHEDGRTFLNRNRNAYDVIYVDAYRSYSVPFQLATREAALRMHASLRDDGVVIMNVISAIAGDQGMFFRALFKTMKSVFPEVHVYAVHDREDETLVQSLMIAAFRKPPPDHPQAHSPETAAYLRHRWTKPIPLDLPVLTDAFAPVERYAKPIVTADPSAKIGIMQERLKSFMSKL